MVIMNRIGGGVTIVIRVFAAGGKGMKSRFLLGAGAALAVTLSWAVGAQAQFLGLPGGPGDFYVGGEGGWSWLQNADIRSGGARGKEHFRGGPAAGVRAGIEWGPLRLEEEFAYRINDTRNFGGVSVNGNRISYALMTKP